LWLLSKIWLSVNIMLIINIIVTYYFLCLPRKESNQRKVTAADEFAEFYRKFVFTQPKPSRNWLFTINESFFCRDSWAACQTTRTQIFLEFCANLSEADLQVLNNHGIY
jgi:hypothetical protein